MPSQVLLIARNTSFYAAILLNPARVCGFHDIVNSTYVFQKIFAKKNKLKTTKISNKDTTLQLTMDNDNDKTVTESVTDHDTVSNEKGVGSGVGSIVASSTSTSTLPSLFCSIGSETTVLSDDDIQYQITKFLNAIQDECSQKNNNNNNPINDVVLVPPDYTRYHSYAGRVTQMICQYYNYIKPVVTEDANKDPNDNDDNNTNNNKTKLDIPEITILPALGTHEPMTQIEIEKMYGSELCNKNPSPFRVHDWRNDVVTIGQVSADKVSVATSGFVHDQIWPAQINKIIWDRRIQTTDSSNNVEGEKESTISKSNQSKNSIVLSIGQVVPHEVMGMANYNKNLFVGTGGVDAINMSHYIGAVIGLEKIMGRTSNPLRDLLNDASKVLLEPYFTNLWYILTVIGTETTISLPPITTVGSIANDDDKTTSVATMSTTRKVVRGLYIGRDIECYLQACELSLKVNFTLLDEPIDTMVVYLDPDTYHSTWLGNKAIYRTRMALATGGQLIILGPGIKKFGEDSIVDKLIRQYGYKGTETIMNNMKSSIELQENLSAVAHLLHGSSEGRFTITYCPGEYLNKSDIEQVGFQYGNINELLLKYNINTLNDGWNTSTITTSGETASKFYYVSNPGLGLWATKSRFFTEDK